MCPIKLLGISKYYEDICALDKIDLTIKEGEILSIIGLNQSGKSTLLKIIANKIFPSSGQITFLNKKNQIEKDISQISYLTEKKEKINDLTLRELISLKQQETNRQDNEIWIEAKKYLNIFDITDKIDYKISQLSDGMKRKFSILLTLLSNSKILIFDKPTLDFDVYSKICFFNILQDLKYNDKILIISTDDFEFAEKCDKLAILDAGKLIFNGSIKKLLNISKLESPLLLTLDKDIPIKELKNLEMIRSISIQQNPKSCKIFFKNFDEGSKILINFLKCEKYAIINYKVEDPSLKDAFLNFLGQK